LSSEIDGEGGFTTSVSALVLPFTVAAFTMCET
jgi:hypothetical protein